jgi:DUF1009 family protein
MKPETAIKYIKSEIRQFGYSVKENEHLIPELVLKASILTKKELTSVIQEMIDLNILN